MKKITTSIIATIFSVIGFAQTDIATARAQGVGATVTITGIVTNGDELGPIRYIEDATAGLALYDPTILIGVVRGDEVTVSGVLVDYNGLMEMNPISTATTNSSANFVFPQVVTPIQIGEATESELVQINNVIFNSGGSLFTAGTHDFTSNAEIGKVYIRAGSPLENSLIPMGLVTLIGISSQYTFSTPANDGYQILPRDSADIIQTGALIFTSSVIQSNITTSSFDLSWNVSDSSTTNCNYGLATSLGTTINSGGNTLTHTISLTGLQPATFYYVECYSVNGNDTAFSNIGIYSTASNSSGIIRPYFNHSVDVSVSTGVDAQNITTYFNDTIKAYMDLADSTLDICVYNASDATIAIAINDAYARGVTVRYIADDDVTNTMLSSLNPNIPIVYRDPSVAGIMHNKFIIVDANSTNNSWVMGGSTNWTNPSNLFNDYNNLIFIQDKAIAKVYTLEFEEMWGGTFGTNKLDNTPHNFKVNGKDIEVYFSPTDQTTSHILEFINEVDYTLEFGLLGFTRDDLGLAVIAKDIQFGVNVRGIIEQENSNGSEFASLVAAGVNVKSHQGVTNQFHHKYAIADANSIASDPTILTGSHNWSSNAENNSDENTLIIHDATIANIYLQEFEKRWGELSSTNAIDELINVEVSIFPNPSAGRVQVKSDLAIQQINLYAVDGKHILTAESTTIDIAVKGIYFLKIVTEKGNTVRKIVVE
ncbi:MAG: T9SS type A sorting domain-containing protein [Flavobacteriales bacterium]|jgi:phosphatidylserine/phosphatidylglycerophosphate/cardiolipin synthase-like enzyme|nr:T9SS type A sorting domain-containing protein [Flavobacteriales bacterium]MBT5750419.1 T9SS type A sorting domain-containing protein [Flavobacteriales bacterium]